MANHASDLCALGLHTYYDEKAHCCLERNRALRDYSVIALPELQAPS